MTMSPSEGGMRVRRMGCGRDVDVLGQVGGTWVGCRCSGWDTWDVGEVGGMQVGGMWARHGWDIGEVGEVGGICGRWGTHNGWGDHRWVCWWSPGGCGDMQRVGGLWLGAMLAVFVGLCYLVSP